MFRNMCMHADFMVSPLSRQKTLTQCWPNVGTPSTTVGQQSTNIGSTSHVAGHLVPGYVHAMKANITDHQMMEASYTRMLHVHDVYDVVHGVASSLSMISLTQNW